MSKSIPTSLLVFVVLLLGACTAAEFFIKRAVNGFQQEITKELKSLADFTSEQKAEIEAATAATDTWMRTDRLVSVQKLTLMLAVDIEKQGQIEPANWSQVANFLNAGLALSDAPDLIQQYAKLTVSLTEEQVDQVLVSFTEELDTGLKKSRDRTVDKQNERIVDGLKWVFRALDQPLTREQRGYAKAFLSARRVDFDFQRQLRISETKQLSEIVKNSLTLGVSEVSRQLRDYFKQIETTTTVPSQADWEYNVDLFLQLINQFLANLNAQECMEMANALRKYERIFNELASSTN